MTKTHPPSDFTYGEEWGNERGAKYSPPPRSSRTHSGAPLYSAWEDWRAWEKSSLKLNSPSKRQKWWPSGWDMPRKPSTDSSQSLGGFSLPKSNSRAKDGSGRKSQRLSPRIGGRLSSKDSQLSQSMLSTHDKSIEQFLKGQQSLKSGTFPKLGSGGGSPKDKPSPRSRPLSVGKSSRHSSVMQWLGVKTSSHEGKLPSSKRTSEASIKSIRSPKSNQSPGDSGLSNAAKSTGQPQGKTGKRQRKSIKGCCKIQ